VQDIPTLDFNVSNAAADLVTSQELRLRRARFMAPVLLGDRLIPVPPLANPFSIPTTGSSRISHHGIVLHTPNDITRKVLLLFRDTDQYFAGFRRAVVTMLPDGSMQEDWGTCFIFDDIIRQNGDPDFMNAVKMGINSAHPSKR